MSMIQLGVRLPKKVTTELRGFCKSHGLIISHFVGSAVEEKLQELKENEEDFAIIESRENEPTLSESEWNKYLKSKDIND